MSEPANKEAMDVVREVGIVLARRALDNPWIDHLWSPHGVLFPAPDCAAGALLSQEGDVRLVYAGEAAVQLYVPETGNYRDNLATGAPLLWIAARTRDGAMPDDLRVTADPTEGEAWHEAGSEIVATVPMPGDIASWIAAFVDAFHVEQVFQKRQRDRSERKERGFGRKPDGQRENGS
ncbi:MAG: molybdopterin-guanine dinucleotide biosynthesis protein [Hyphomicrobiales bacterium]|jgi:hypothetical protein|nr:molybdopterin-guanine dinucleotide biosynthesis protein [Hyphomicrobiales bacterium]